MLLASLKLITLAVESSMRLGEMFLGLRVVACRFQRLFCTPPGHKER